MKWIHFLLGSSKISMVSMFDWYIGISTHDMTAQIVLSIMLWTHGTIISPVLYIHIHILNPFWIGGWDWWLNILRISMWPSHSNSIWAIYYKSLTWLKAILGRIPLANHHLRWPLTSLVAKKIAQGPVWVLWDHRFRVFFVSFFWTRATPWSPITSGTDYPG